MSKKNGIQQFCFSKTYDSIPFFITAFTNCQKISTDNSKPPQYKTGFYNTQIEKLDSLVLPSTFKYAKAHKKEVINKIEAL